MRGGLRARPAFALLLLVPLCILATVLSLSTTQFSATAATTVDEVHYTLTGPTSVAFDWRGSATDIQYGNTTSYGSSATAQAPSPMPFSSAGPFQEVELTGLDQGTTYHYSIGGGLDQTFTTAPVGNFRFDVIADIGSSLQSVKAATTQIEVAADNPAFVLAIGDLTYGSPYGQSAVDQHFNDVMVWSQTAAYMPAWGNHEWDAPAVDDLRNYKGRFKIPNAQASPNAPSAGCCGEDWGWFDAGGVRFISYPEPYKSGANGTFANWETNVDPIMAAAQADPSINYIVTFGHRPAYSTGFHPGNAGLASIIDRFGDKYSKYVLNLNGHSHNYERFTPIHGVTHITSGGGGASLEPPWSSEDPRTAYRAMHLHHLRIDVGSDGMKIEALCGPPTAKDDTVCVEGSVIDSYTVSPVATLTLLPKAATNTVGAQHCLTATVKNRSGAPAGGVSVRFSVSGANTASGSATSDAAGNAGFCYTGTSAGTDTIYAFADTNNNGTNDTGESGDTASKANVAPVPPAPTSGTVHATPTIKSSCLVPKVRGLSLAKAKKRLRRAHCTYRIRGKGRVVSTSPRAGKTTTETVLVKAKRKRHRGKEKGHKR
jgi:hypothetical protein